MENLDIESIKFRQHDQYVDFFRIILMVMITAHHSIVHGMELANLRNNIYVKTSGYIFFLNSFLIVSVNCFFWISGFFGIKFKLKRIIALVIEVMFYILLINIILLLINKTVLLADVLEIIKNTILFLNSY